MTHNELLDKIDINLLTQDHTVPWDTLRQIAELHTYVLTGKKMRGKAGLSKRCTECGFAYPCSTIELIQKELG